MDLMSEGQWKRWDAVARLAAGKLTTDEAARVLRLSVRQVRRAAGVPPSGVDAPAATGAAAIGRRRQG